MRFVVSPVPKGERPGAPSPWFEMDIETMAACPPASGFGLIHAVPHQMAKIIFVKLDCLNWLKRAQV